MPVPDSYDQLDKSDTKVLIPESYETDDPLSQIDIDSTSSNLGKVLLNVC